ncbi:hypothetical protein CBR_g44312 [Chara braunii]|uniref:mannan endo-1,4-beta-mannosidase n=1 Tax=Chara braunii TaxID=69332 RepID=A0A388K318_CHABU|nr:hypothetical protein CBR_g44312 [Chara braunii]|eukprot:GBG64427.1 hypothetical protein CBR_g44312 [Chara braunii]
MMVMKMGEKEGGTTACCCGRGGDDGGSCFFSSRCSFWGAHRLPRNRHGIMQFWKPPMIIAIVALLLLPGDMVIVPVQGRRSRRWTPLARQHEHLQQEHSSHSRRIAHSLLRSHRASVFPTAPELFASNPQEPTSSPPFPPGFLFASSGDSTALPSLPPDVYESSPFVDLSSSPSVPLQPWPTEPLTPVEGSVGSASESSSSPPEIPSRPYNAKEHWEIVRANCTQLITGSDGPVFKFAGWNSRNLMYASATPEGQQSVLKILSQAQSMGLTVCRVMACNDGDGFPYIHPHPDVFNETYFLALDWLLNEAASRGIRLLLVLANNWESKQQYVRWVFERGFQTVSAEEARRRNSSASRGNEDDSLTEVIDPVERAFNQDDFFSDPLCKQWYKDLVAKVVGRTNTITGVAYQDDPAIFGWQLMNEPRTQSEISGESLQAWIAEMAAYVKSLDPNHLLSHGSEGFLGPSAPQYLWINPPADDDWPRRQGNDFLKESAVKDIDILTVHIYPELWMAGFSFDSQMAFIPKWIKGHMEIAGKHFQKPIMFDEFGFVGLRENRDVMFRIVYDKLYPYVLSGQLAGSMFWAMDDINAYFSSWSVSYDRDLATTVPIIAEHARKVNALMATPIS